MTLKAETPLVWTKSSYSTDEGPDCVEAATTPATVLVRDSKTPTAPASPSPPPPGRPSSRPCTRRGPRAATAPTTGPPASKPPRPPTTSSSATPKPPRPPPHPHPHRLGDFPPLRLAHAMTTRLPLDEQLAALQDTLSRNETLLEVLNRTATLDLPGWYLTAGCLFQTVWNVATGRPPAEGIKDYDVFYFDDGDLSWESEDKVIRAAADVFADLPADVEVRNEARVHLWYERKFGVPCAPTPPPKPPSTASPRPPAVSASASPPTAGGGCTRRTGCPTCSGSSYGPTPSSRPAPCTRRRPSAGAGSGRSSPCWTGPRPERGQTTAGRVRRHAPPSHTRSPHVVERRLRAPAAARWAG